MPSRGDDSIRALALLLVLGTVPVAASAVDVPVIGTRLSLSASANDTQPRTVSFRALDNVIVAPLPDPSSGASLRVFGSNAVGQCHAAIDLPAANWSAIGGDGPTRGWRYRDKSAGSFGIRSIVVRPGKVIVRGRGVAFPCGLEADQQTVPVSVVLRMGGMRYCATFGGAVHTNKPQHFRATNAPPPAVCPDTADVTVATLNILHGLGCGADFCRQEDRVVLAGQFIVDRGCPDVVALQEVINIGEPSVVTAAQNHLLDVCPFPYQLVYMGGNNLDDSLLLTRYPPIATELRVLENDFRNVLFARLDHPAGALDVFSTHLASGSDGGPNPCGPDCPPECVAAGAVTLRDCQAVQTALMIEERHDIATPALLLGDFNSPPGSFVYAQFAGRGWTDAYLAAGNPECDSGTGIGCTSGRIDGALTDLQSPALNLSERIDYVFLVPAASGSSCVGALDSGADADGDGTATRLFADVPNPFAPTCGAAPNPICWSSDHDGVQADINCE